MIKSILACTDGSPGGDAACDLAIQLARASGARLRALHVLDSRLLEGPLMADISGWVGAQPYAQQLDQFHELLQKKGENILAAFAERARVAGIEASHNLAMGHPARVILQEESSTELIVLGLRGEHARIIGDMLGSNAERVIRHAVKPCLLTPGGRPALQRALLAYDGSPQAGEALREIAELASALRAEIVCLCVAEKEEEENQARDHLHHATLLARDHGVTPTPLLRIGDAVEQILEVAKTEQCGLIGLGTHPHSRLHDLLFGSTRTHLLARTSVPVLLVR